MTCYNVFALPVLTYVAQLLSPPLHTLRTENVAMLRIAPGPTNWISNTDLVWLQHLTGHPRSLASLTLTYKAAQTRVRVWDAACADNEPDPGTPLDRYAMTALSTTSTHDFHPNNLTTTSSFSQRANYLRRLRRIISAPDELYT